MSKNQQRNLWNEKGLSRKRGFRKPFTQEFSKDILKFTAYADRLKGVSLEPPQFEWAQLHYLSFLFSPPFKKWEKIRKIRGKKYPLTIQLISLFAEFYPLTFLTSLRFILQHRNL